MVMTAREILGSVIPEIQLDNVTLENTSDGQTKVRVNFCIYDLVDKNEIGTWFEQIEYEQYFRPSIQLTYSFTEFDRSQIIELPTREEVFPITGINLPKTDYISSDGYRVNKFPFEFVTTLPPGDPYYLKVKMTSEFDIDLLEQNEGIDLSFMGTDFGRVRYTRKIKSQLLIDERQTKYPFQDFRSRNLVNKLEIDETGIIAQFSQKYEEASRRLDDNSARANDFMSDFLITRNAQGEAKFLFTFDARSFYNKKSQYRKYFSKLTPTDQRTVLARTDINSLRILRKRVKLTSDGLGKPNVVDFGDYESIKALCETRKPSNNTEFITVSNDHAAVKQIDIQVRDSYGLYFITGTDYEVAKKTCGAYAYGVSVEIVDNLKSILREKLAEVENHINEMKSLYYKMSSPDNYDAILNLSKNSLSQIDPTAEDRISNIIINFKDVCSIFTENFLSGDSNSKFKNLCDSIQQPSPSPEVIEVFFTLMETLLFKARTDIGEPADSSSPVSRKASDIRIKSEKYYDTPEKIFDASIPKVDGMEYLVNFSTRLPQTALEEISSLAYDTGDIGLKVIDAATFEKRFTSEVERFFSSESAVIFPELTQGSTTTESQVSLTGVGSEYFTPSAFFNGNSSSPVSVSNIKDHDSLSEAIKMNLLSTGNLDNIGKLAGAPLLLPPKGSKEAAFLSQQGAIFYDVDKETTLLKRELGSDESTRAVSETVERIQNASEIRREQTTRDFESFVFSKMSKILSGPNLGTQRTLNNASGLADNYESDVEGRGVDLADFERTPNPLKAFSLINTGQSALTRFEPESITQGTYSISMSFLMKLEYLSGFEKNSEGENLVMKPIFAPLTLDIYRENKARSLLCRLSKVASGHFGIRKTPSNKPIFDSVFVVRPVEFERIAESRVFEFAEAEATAAEIVGSTYDAVAAAFRADLEELRDERESLQINADTKAVRANDLNEQIRESEQEVRNLEIQIRRLRNQLMSGNLSGPQRNFNQMNTEQFKERRRALLFSISAKETEVEMLSSEIADMLSQVQEISSRIDALEKNL